MLEKPAIQDNNIIICIQNAYKTNITEITFLPLGADINTAVYRATAADGTLYFAKLRRGIFEENSVVLPKLLYNQGIPHIIPPITTAVGQLWTQLDEFTVILYPFVTGRDGYAVALSDRQWRDFGAALKRIHSADIPSEIIQHTQHETFSPQWRERVTAFLSYRPDTVAYEPIVAALMAFLQEKHNIITDLVDRAQQFADELIAQPQQFVLCHSDIHAGNIFIDVNGHLYIVDWDNPIFAPKERDLMFIGGAQGFIARTPQEEEMRFYQGYGHTPTNPAGIAYYRYERIIQDIAAYCEQLFLTSGGHEDREQSLRYLMSNFLPGGTIERAYAADPTLSNT